MSSLLSNATQRAIRNIVGPDLLEILIETVADQDYPLALAIPVGYKVLSVTTDLSAGTCTLNVKKVTTGGVASSIAGLGAIAVTTTLTTTLPTGNGTEVLAQGEGIRLTVSGNAGGTNLSVAVKAQRQNGYSN